MVDNLTKSNALRVSAQDAAIMERTSSTTVTVVTVSCWDAAILCKIDAVTVICPSWHQIASAHILQTFPQDAVPITEPWTMEEKMAAMLFLEDFNLSRRSCCSRILVVKKFAGFLLVVDLFYRHSPTLLQQTPPIHILIAHRTYAQPLLFFWLEF